MKDCFWRIRFLCWAATAPLWAIYRGYTNFLDLMQYVLKYAGIVDLEYNMQICKAATSHIPIDKWLARIIQGRSFLASRFYNMFRKPLLKYENKATINSQQWEFNSRVHVLDLVVVDKASVSPSNGKNEKLVAIATNRGPSKLTLSLRSLWWRPYVSRRELPYAHRNFPVCQMHQQAESNESCGGCSLLIVHLHHLESRINPVSTDELLF